MKRTARCTAARGKRVENRDRCRQRANGTLFLESCQQHRRLPRQLPAFPPPRRVQASLAKTPRPGQQAGSPPQAQQRLPRDGEGQGHRGGKLTDFLHAFLQISVRFTSLFHRRQLPAPPTRSALRGHGFVLAGWEAPPAHARPAAEPGLGDRGPPSSPQRFASAGSRSADCPGWDYRNAASARPAARVNKLGPRKGMTQHPPPAGAGCCLQRRSGTRRCSSEGARLPIPAAGRRGKHSPGPRRAAGGCMSHPSAAPAGSRSPSASSSVTAYRKRGTSPPKCNSIHQANAFENHFYLNKTLNTLHKTLKMKPKICYFTGH